MSQNKDSKQLSQQRFGRFASGYLTSTGHAKGFELDRLIEIAEPQADWKVLDVATGGGHTALKFAPLVAHVTATDITPQMLDKARAFIGEQGIENISFEPADAEQLPFEDHAFDLVTCRIAPHHFPSPARFVRESARVLRPGGTLLVQDHVLPEDRVAARAIDAFERLRDPSHNRALAQSEWVGLFEEAGLKVVHTEQIIKQHAFIPWAERQGCKDDVIADLVKMVATASPAVAAWLQPRAFGTPEATFVNHHLIIAGRKGQ